MILNKRHLAITIGATLTAAAVILSPLDFRQKSQDQYQAFKNLDLSANSPFGQSLTSLLKTNSARAMGVKSGATESAVNLTRMNVGFVLGYGSRSAYEGLVCDPSDPAIGTTDSCDGPPQKGLVGILADVINKVPLALGVSGIATCDAIPTTGTSTVTVGSYSFTFKYNTPTHSNPTGWANAGGAYTKRLEFNIPDEEGMRGAIEFTCDQPTIFLAIDMPVGSNAPGYNRGINGYFGEMATSTTKGIEVFLSEYLVATPANTRTSVAVRINYDSLTSKAQIWGVSSVSFDNGNEGAARFAAHTNVTTGVGSLFYSQLTVADAAGDAIDTSALAAISSGTPYAASAYAAPGTFALTTTLAGTSTGTLINHQGCINFSAPSTAAANATLCTGLPLASPTAGVAIDASGSLSAQWVFASMANHLDKIP